MIRVTLLCLFLLASLGAFAQKIPLKNPSFEDTPAHSIAPIGWEDGGFAGESPPDIHPSGAFSVTTEAHHGKTYLGLVVRDNNTWESVYQNLETPLVPEKVYKMKICLARSEVYISVSKVTEQPANFNTACILRVWGGNDDKKEVILAQTEPVIHSDWQYHTLTFTTDQEFSQIFLEAFYSSDETIPNNGNILLDDMSLEVVKQ